MQEEGAPNLFTIARDTSDAKALEGVMAGGASRLNAYHEIMDGLSKAESKRRSPVGWYVDALHQAVSGFCKHNYGWWSHA